MPANPKSTDDAIQVITFATELGWMAIAVRNARVISIKFGHRSAGSAVRALKAGRPTSDSDLFADHGCSLGRDLAARLESFATGQAEDFRDVPLDFGDMTRFQRRVSEACRQVGWGQTASYAELAARAGSPRAARAVGNAMAANPLPIIVPCHRIIGASGALCGFSAPNGLNMKRRLLRLEGSLS